MKRVSWWPIVFAIAGLVFAITVAFYQAANNPPFAEATSPVCYTFHRGVVVVPAVCKEHDICETAIEAKVCDSILIPKAKP